MLFCKNNYFCKLLGEIHVSGHPPTCNIRLAFNFTKMSHNISSFGYHSNNRKKDPSFHRADTKQRDSDFKEQMVKHEPVTGRAVARILRQSLRRSGSSKEHGICCAYRQGCAYHLQEVGSLCAKATSCYSQKKARVQKHFPSFKCLNYNTKNINNIKPS